MPESLVLRKNVKVKFYIIKLLMTNVVFLIQGKPQGSLSRISSKGFYYRIALSETYIPIRVGNLHEVLMYECSFNV